MTPAAVVSPAKRSPGRLISGVGLAVLFAATVVTLVVNTRNPSGETTPQGALRVPASLAGNPMVTSLRGAAALADVSRLHGKTIDAVDAAVARYQNGATLWVSASPSALAASRLLWRMNRRMANGTQVFSAPRPQQIGGRSVFVTEGIGQIHYYYQSGARVIWLALPPGLHASVALETLLNVYP